MANEVYANNMEISCKAASGKSIAAFPDVCFTPPQAPPTPLGYRSPTPIPACPRTPPKVPGPFASPARR